MPVHHRSATMAPHVTTLALWLAVVAVQTAHSCAPPRMSDVQVQADFQLDKFLGLWYELDWIPENWFPPEYNYDDFIAYIEQKNDTLLNLYSAGRETAGLDSCIMNNNPLIPQDTPGKFTYVRIGNLTTGALLESDYWVVLTDYDNYMLVYGCRERGADDVCLDGQVDSWVWSRQTTMSDAHRQIVDEKIAELCVNTTLYFKTDHVEACPYPSNYVITLCGEMENNRSLSSPFFPRFSPTLVSSRAVACSYELRRSFYVNQAGAWLGRRDAEIMVTRDFSPAVFPPVLYHVLSLAWISWSIIIW